MKSKSTTQKANRGLVIDADRFEQLYHAHWKRLFDYCRFHTREAAAAEEMVQDIFLSVWERRHTIGSINDDFLKYLIRAAKLKIFDYHKLRMSSKQTAQLGDYTPVIPCRNTEEALQYDDLVNVVDRLVESLPPKCREVYRLSHKQGMDKPEIAQVLRITVKTVEYHLYKAIRYLREQLPPELNG